MYVFDRLLGKASIKKKRFLSGIAQISYPPWPQFGQLGPFFFDIKIQLGLQNGGGGGGYN